VTADDRPTAYVDANVLVAFLAGPAHPAHAAARSIMGRVGSGDLLIILTPIVVAEALWLARGVLGVDRPTAVRWMSDLLRAPGVEATEAPVLGRALDLMVRHPRLDVADAWIAARALSAGPPMVASLDRDLDAIEGIDRLGD
jgi:predicted nucleic acid-binding protein